MLTTQIETFEVTYYTPSYNMEVLSMWGYYRRVALILYWTNFVLIAAIIV